MIRRAAWLGSGVVLGVTGAVWGRRQAGRLAERLTEQVRPNRMAESLSSGVQATVRRGSARFADALAAGRADATRREADLRRQLRLVEGDAPRRAPHRVATSRGARAQGGGR